MQEHRTYLGTNMFEVKITYLELKCGYFNITCPYSDWNEEHRNPFGLTHQAKCEEYKNDGDNSLDTTCRWQWDKPLECTYATETKKYEINKTDGEVIVGNRRFEINQIVKLEVDGITIDLKDCQTDYIPVCDSYFKKKV